jgi:hypothetical protein
MTDEQALAQLIIFLETGPDDDALCAAALTIVEPLIDWHWATALPAFEQLADRSDALRKSISCCDFDASVPEAVRSNLYSLVGPGEDIGHEPTH